jgi:predicted ArsR family transcriptional regulator
LPDDDLADVVRRDIDEHIDSLDSLEVVMLIFREQSRRWSSDQVASRLRISGRVARRELERMRSRGTAKAVDDDTFQFEVSDPDKAAAVARIAAMYGSRRIELINYVASQTLKRIQSIADAFKLRKERGG